MKNIITVIVLMLLSLHARSDEYLRIGDVQDSWTTYPGSIDKAEFIILPKGMYAECQVLLDFSVRCTPFTGQYDSLEIQMGFRLPAEAEVIDMWLWVGATPVQAGIYDRWSASLIYEDIVDRRKDPALLVKQSDTDYELHIFPLMVNMPRKIKMTFLLPFNQLTGHKSFVALPLNILKLSECAVDTFRVIAKPALNLGNPEILELPQMTFTSQNISPYGTCYVANITNPTSLTSLTLSLTPAGQSDYFGSYYPVSGSGQGIYQIELNLAGLLGVNQAKKTLFLFDFVKSKSSLNRSHVIESFKNYVLSFFETGDSINIMFSGYTTNLVSNSWVSADSSSLSQILNSVDTNDFNNYTNLAALLFDGIDFIRSNGNQGNIVLIASSDGYQNTTDANTFLTDLMTYMGNPKIPIHTISLDDQSWLIYAGNTYYRGNEYLYGNLSTLTGGEFQTIMTYETAFDPWWWYYWYEPVYTSYENMMGTVFPKLTGFFSALNVYVDMQSGFTFANYTISSVNGFVYFDSPFRQVGKYTGTFPMNVSISAQTPDGQLYNTDISIDSTQLFYVDSVSKNIWAGQYLRQLMSYNQTNSVVYQIVQTSMNERVLSRYSAFLALEAGMTPPDTITIPTVAVYGGPVGVEEMIAAGKTLNGCYPNPVIDFTNFYFTLNEPANVLIEIFDLQGRLIVAEQNGELEGGSHIISFSANQIIAGIYFYTIKANGIIAYSGKLIKLKAVY